MEIELARINVVEHRNDHKEPDVPVKLKLQPYDHKSKDDILTYLSEFEGSMSKRLLSNSIFTVLLLAAFLVAPLVFFGGPMTSVSSFSSS
jgi:hypothetical protein